MASEFETINRQRPSSFFAWIVVIIAIFLCAKILLPTVTDVPTKSAKIKHAAKYDMNILCAALQEYNTEYRQAPSGPSSNILKALLGDNPQKILFLVADPKQISTRGEYLDPWGTPYHLDTSNATEPRIYSDGPNKQDNFADKKSDDIASWR